MGTLSLRGYRIVFNFDLSNGVRPFVPDTPPISLRALLGAAVPGVPTNFKVDWPSELWLRASWSAPIRATSYQLQRTDHPEIATSWELATIYNNNMKEDNSATSIHFRPPTKHTNGLGVYSRVKAENSIGTSDWSDSVYAQYTPPPPPPPPKPTINFFKVSPPSDGDPTRWYQNFGEWATLSWSITGEVQTVSLTSSNTTFPKVNNPGSSGTMKFQPNQPNSGSIMTVTLAASNSGGTAKAYVYIAVYYPSTSGTQTKWYYFKMTGMDPIFALAVLAPDEPTAQEMAENQNGGYTATPITEQAYYDGSY